MKPTPQRRTREATDPKDAYFVLRSASGREVTRKAIGARVSFVQPDGSGGADIYDLVFNHHNNRLVLRSAKPDGYLTTLDLGPEALTEAESAVTKQTLSVMTKLEKAALNVYSWLCYAEPRDFEREHDKEIREELRAALEAAGIDPDAQADETA